MRTFSPTDLQPMDFQSIVVEFNHRLLHWKPLYDISHELHHRNMNTGPWTGISMHPIEHVIYFSLFLLWWVVPVHPILIIFTGFFQGIGPGISHSGFDYMHIGKSLKIKTGDNFHNLHHRYFHINYGNSMTPVDRILTAGMMDPSRVRQC